MNEKSCIGHLLHNICQAMNGENQLLVITDELVSMMQCFFDQPLCKTLKRFSRIWFFLRSGLPWIIWRQRNNLDFNVVQWSIEKMHQVIQDALQDYSRIKRKRTLSDLEKGLDVAYQNILKEFDSLWGVKGLIMSHPQQFNDYLKGQTSNGHYFLISSWIALVLPRWLCFHSSLQLNFQFVQKTEKERKMNQLNFNTLPIIQRNLYNIL